MTDVVHTPQANELFHLTIKNFVDIALDHRHVLMVSYLSLAPEDIDKWIEGKDLPDDMSQRVHIMDFIWTHYCNCKCI